MIRTLHGTRVEIARFGPVLTNDDGSLVLPRERGLHALNAYEVLTTHLFASLVTGAVPTSLRDHPNRTQEDFIFPFTEEGAPVPPWTSWTCVVFPLVVGYLDLGTDASAVISYYQAGHTWWFAIGLAVIVGPTLFAAIVVFRYEHWLRRVCVALHLGLLLEAFLSWGNATYSSVLVSLRVVEPLYESTPQLMLQMYVLLLEWGSEGAQHPLWRVSSVVTSCFSLAYATTGLVAAHPLSSLAPTVVAGSQGDYATADRRAAAQTMQSTSERFGTRTTAVVTDDNANRAGIMPPLGYEGGHDREGGIGISTPSVAGVDGSSAWCPCRTGQLFGWVSEKVFDTVPADGSVEVYRSRWHPQHFMWAFLLYQLLEIGSRFLSLALLALVLRAYFFLVLLWFVISRSSILCFSLGRVEHRQFRSQLIRVVGMPFMDSVMDALISYDAACALTTVEFVACVAVNFFVYTNEVGQVPDHVRLDSINVAVGLMAGKLVLGFLIVRPFKRVVGFGSGLGDEREEEQSGRSQHRNRTNVSNRNVESGGSSRDVVSELVGPERRPGARV